MRHEAAATLLVDAIAAEAVTALDRAGVPSVLLKGPAVAAWLYQPSEVRTYSDVDLLVPPRSLGAAERVLAALGFRYVFDGVNVLERPSHARTWIRVDDPPIDLHIGLGEVPAPSEDVWAVLSDGATKLDVGTAPVLVPDTASLALIVALHALQHGPDEPRLIDELGRAVTSTGTDVWQEAADAAAKLNASGLLRAALGLVEAGPALADELDLPAAPVRAVILATASAGARTCALGLDRIGAAPSWREKAALLVRAVIPTPAYLRGTEGTSGTGLASSYGRRLARLRSVVEGFRAWRSAVRECGASRRLSDRIEVVAWSLAARVGIGTVGVKATLRLFDLIPLQRRGGERLAFTERDALFRLAGRCLGESIARSAYLRLRGSRHELVLGVRRSANGVQGHAWLEPFDTAPPEFEVIHRFGR